MSCACPQMFAFRVENSERKCDRGKFADVKHVSPLVHAVVTMI